MSMKEAILAFNEQLKYEPVIENQDKLIVKNKLIVCGMGGSHLAADILQGISPRLHLVIHEDYGLPQVSASEYDESMVIISSYSGNTEEVVDAYNKAKELKLSLIVISVGGKLIDLAKSDNLPYIQIPETGIQPRSALGYNLLSFLKAIGEDEYCHELNQLANTLRPADLEIRGEELAKNLKDKVPVIYSSRRNYSVAYNWKIKFNETGKIPAFYNVLPELNHNEMTGFDVKDSSKHLSESFHFIFIKDDEDDARLLKRFDVLEKLYNDRELPVTVIELKGATRLEKIFNSLLLADWTAVHTAELYDLESEQVPMVEEFKKLIA